MSDIVDQVLSYLEVDAEIIERGKARQEAIWMNRSPDYLPILLGGAPVPEAESFPRFDFEEQFHDRDKMLVTQLWNIISTARCKSDSQLLVRASFGPGFLATVFGIGLRVFTHTNPWVDRHLSKEEILSLTKDKLGNVGERGLVPRAIEYSKYFMERLEGRMPVYLPDTQGPFDLAHLVRGEDIFTDMYDDPDFVHHLMDLCTYVYIEATKAIKEAIGERLDGGYHGNGCPQNGFYLHKGGVRICEDTTIMLSPSLIQEFVLPYTRTALSAFGGGFIHWCGDGNHFLDMYLDTDEVKGINFGNPEMYDYESTVQRTIDKGKFICMGWPKLAGEKVEDYFIRMLAPLRQHKKGIIFIAHGNPYIESEWSDPPAIVELWRDLQR